MQFYQQFCEETFGPDGSLTGFRVKCAENYNFGYDVVDAIAARDPEKRAVVWCSPDGPERTFTFEDIRRLSNQAANVFRAQGIGRGDKVMVVLKRHYEYWFVSIALHKLGAVLVPVTHMLTADDLAYRVDLAHIKAAVCTPEGPVCDNLLEVRARCPGLEHLWVAQADREGFHNLTSEMSAAPDALERQETLAAEPMILYFTSGTTGYPKAVMHDHTYSLAHILTAKYWQQVQDGGLHFTVAETGWGKASWGKLYGQWLCGSAVMVFDFDNFDPRQLMAVINRYAVTTFCAPPTVYRYFVKKGIAEMPSLRHATTAGEALSPEIFRQFQAKTGIPLMEGFGQTESTLILANLAGSTPKPGAMGRPTPLYHVELLKDDGSYAGPGEVGEIVVVPPEDGGQHGIFMGYCDNDALYRYVWRGGVYHTGDTAWKDEDGDYWYNGRIDDIIKTGGFRVGPYEIEDVIMEHPAVLECSVVGVPDELRGQAIKAFVVLAPTYEPAAELKRELRDNTNEQLAQYKWIRTLEFVEELPKTISGKIRKVELRSET